MESNYAYAIPRIVLFLGIFLVGWFCLMNGPISKRRVVMWIRHDIAMSYNGEPRQQWLVDVI